MDTVQIEKDKFSVVEPELKKIAGLKDAKGITDLMAYLHLYQASPGFGYFIMADMKNSEINMPYVFQSGTGLPEKDYYQSDDMKEIREEYKKHIAALFTLMGEDATVAQKHAEMAFNIEAKLADSSLSAVESRDLERVYNKKSVEDLQKLAPDFDWKKYFTAMGTPSVKEVIVDNPAFLRQFNNLIKSESPEAWQAYFRWHFVHLIAGKMHKDVADENFRFWGTTLSGQTAQQPRWKRVMQSTEGALGDALGQLYVQRNFSEEAKTRVNTMVDNLIAAYAERIKTRDWMSETTKAQATEKLKKIMRKLAFPDKWRSYAGLSVSRKSYVRNYLNSNQFDAKWLLGKYGKPVDKTEWGMTPATVNAYYNPSYNEIVFPAAIMQAPFFDAKADDAVNYGAMGAVIGHELTHGFDDQGSMFDGNGNMQNWWTDDDRAKFEAKTKMLTEQFNQYVVIDSTGLKVNGELTLGENIADLGGLTISYYAFQMAQKKTPQPAKIDGFTPNQRFFISWAQAWRNSQRPKSLMMMVKTNPHSPARFRVLGPLSNMKEFYDAFDVKEGDKMYRKPNERVEIW
jgi:putative endopeptidase